MSAPKAYVSIAHLHSYAEVIVRVDRTNHEYPKSLSQCSIYTSWHTPHHKGFIQRKCDIFITANGLPLQCTMHICFVQMSVTPLAVFRNATDIFNAQDCGQQPVCKNAIRFQYTCIIMNEMSTDCVNRGFEFFAGLWYLPQRCNHSASS